MKSTLMLMEIYLVIRGRVCANVVIFKGNLYEDIDLCSYYSYEC